MRLRTVLPAGISHRAAEPQRSMVALSAVAVGSVLVSLFVVLMPDSAQAQTQTDDPSGCTNLVTPVPDQTIDPEVKLKSSPQNGGVIEFGSSRTPLLGRVQFPIETLPEATKIIAPVEVDVPMTKQGSVSPLKNAFL